MRFNGDHTERVTLKKRSISYNDFNEQVEDWDSNDTEMYAEFWEKHGKEGDTDGQILVMQDVRCKIRYREDLDPDYNHSPESNYRIKRGVTVYDVVSIVKEGRRKALLLMLTRRDNV
jgi:head-tail adaptor